MKNISTYKSITRSILFCLAILFTTTVFNSDYSIQGTSPAKDAGQVITLPLVGTLPYNGSLPDIGYKEYIP